MELICLQLDLARQKENVEYVKSYMDFAVRNGYNSILLYLENAVRTPSTEYFDREDTYSTEEMSEIAAYGTEKGLEIIPAFENLGHMEKFFEYPDWEELSECEDTTKEGRGFERSKRGSCGCVNNPKLYEKIDLYIQEVASLFPCNYIHMGLDEPFDFAVCPRCQERIANGATKADLFYEHIMHTYKLVKAMGKTMMMWDDFFEYADVVDRLPRDIIFCNWNYFFVADEPAGHWTNRIKRDWFRYYEKLGFRYIFCTYAHRASSLYNLESFARYASKYKPFGSITTTWMRSDSFYLGAMPFMASAGQLLSGKISTDEEILKVYSEFVGEDCAKLLTSLSVASYFYGYNDFRSCCESEYYLKYAYKKQLSLVVEQLREYESMATGLAKDILTDIYGYIYGIYLELEIQSVGTRLYDGYETNNVLTQPLVEKLLEIKNGYNEIECKWRGLWEKYRVGIKSQKNKFANRFNTKQKLLDDLIEAVNHNYPQGVLYADLMLHDGFSTVRVEIQAKYIDGEEGLVYKGAVKPSMTGLESGGGYAFRYPLKNKCMEFLQFTVFGEGVLYPMNFRYLLDGKQYIADKVETVCGWVKNPEKVLTNDTRFAELGYEDGLRHFNELALSKERSTIKIYFKEL